MSENQAARRQYSLRAKLLLLIGTLAAMALIGELATRLFFPSDRLEYVVDDELIWRLRPSQRGHNEVPGVFELETVNAAGFRGPAEFDPTDKRPRVLLLGDSYTWGSGVADDATLNAELDRLAGGQWQVINAGMPGWGLFQMELQLRRVMAQVRPQVVVVVLMEDDIYRQPYDDPAEQAAEVRRGRWKNHVRAASRLLTVLVRSYERARQSAAGAAVRNEQPRSIESYSRCWQRDRARLDEMRAFCRENASDFLVVGWPIEVSTTEFFREQLAEWGSQSNTPTIDLYDSLITVDKSKRTLSDGHPNPLGFQLAAGPISAAIIGCLEEAERQPAEQSGENGGL